MIDHRFRQIGGHMLMNRMRGEGPPYRDIVLDICKRNKIDAAADDGIVALEKKLAIRKYDDAYAKLSPAQQEEFRRAANEALAASGSTFKLDSSVGKPAAALALLAGANLSGFWAYKATAILANAFAKALVGHGLRFGANAALMRGLGVALGPLGWAAMGVATVHQLTGHDKTAVEKGVLHVALLRQAKLYEQTDAARSPALS